MKPSRLLANCHPEFQRSIADLAAKYGKTVGQVWELWLAYTEACCDQSALLFEFERQVLERPRTAS